MKINHAHISIGIMLMLLPGFVQAQAFWDLPENLNTPTGYVFAGVVTWTEQNTVRSDSIVWTMRILEFVKRGTVRAWKITGHPMDLAWYKPGMKPIHRTVIEVAGRSYYITSKDVFNRIIDKQDSLRELVWESELVLDLPLSKARAFGEAEMLRREDGLYAWRVEDIKDLAKTHGTVQTDKDHLFTVVYRAMNFIILTEWRKGPGIVRYRYRHYGTATDCDVVLERGFGAARGRGPE